MNNLSSKDQQEVIFTTVSTTNYLPRAMIMARSVKRHVPNSKVMVCIVEDKIPKTTTDLYSFFDEIVLAKDLGIPDFNRFIFQYTQGEGSNACKAQLLIYLLEKYKSINKFIFLDADTKVFGPFTELLGHLEISDILISPHFISFNDRDPLYHLTVIHRTGIFNTGLFAIRRGDEALRFLHWWANILLKYCLSDPRRGIWNEQKWLDVSSGLFNFHILKDPGYNVGPWNFHERIFTRDNNGQYLINEQPLCLFHFSGISINYFEDRLKFSDPEQREIISQLKNDYLQQLLAVDKDSLRDVPWSYNYFSSGRLIHNNSRINFRKKPKYFYHIADPFLHNNKSFRFDGKQNIKGKKGKRKLVK